MVIKRSPGGQACWWRAINFEIHLWSSGKNADCIFGDRSASSMSKWRPAWTLTPEMIHFRTKSVTLSMLIDLLIIVHVDRRRWRAHQLTYDLKRCLLFRKCLRFFESESSFGATSVIGGLGAPWQPAILLDVTLVAVKELSRYRSMSACG